MTIFSLGSACNLEHFSSLTHGGSNLENQSIVPMPNSGNSNNSQEFGNSSYTWKSDSTASIDMTTRDGSLFNAASEGGNFTKYETPVCFYAHIKDAICKK